MAGIHRYKHEGRSVALYAIDHSVGRGGSNRMDDVQLIQALINRYIVATETVAKRKGPKWTARTLDSSGRVINKLRIDGQCGPLTLAAILAVQRSFNYWRGCTVDGLIDAVRDGSASYHKTGRVQFTYLAIDKRGKYVHEKFMCQSWSAMYFLAAYTNAFADRLIGIANENFGLEPFDVYSLPNPLKSSLLRASVGATVEKLVNLAGG